MDVILLGEISDLISGVNTNISNTKGSVDWGNGYLQNTIYPELITTRDHAVASNNNASGAYSYLANNVWPRIENNIWPTIANQIWPQLNHLHNTRRFIGFPGDTTLRTLSTGGTIDCPLNNNQQTTGQAYMYDGMWGGTHVAKSGVYRLYGTAGLTLVKLSSGRNSSAKVTMVASVTRASGSGATWYEVELCSLGEYGQSAGATAAATTKYIDIGLQEGDYVLTLYRLTGVCNQNPCGGLATLANFQANCGEMSFRGGLGESSGAFL